MRFALMLILLSLPVPAWADWQYTKWGMSVSQVVAASNGQVVPVQGAVGDQVHSQDLRAEGRYTAVGMSFKAQFYFAPRSGGLSVVRLLPNDMANCSVLSRELAGIYGVGAPTGVGFKWFDARQNLEIQFTRYDSQCLIVYRPLARTAPTGL